MRIADHIAIGWNFGAVERRIKMMNKATVFGSFDFKQLLWNVETGRAWNIFVSKISQADQTKQTLIDLPLSFQLPFRITIGTNAPENGLLGLSGHLVDAVVPDVVIAVQPAASNDEKVVFGNFVTFVRKLVRYVDVAAIKIFSEIVAKWPVRAARHVTLISKIAAMSKPQNWFWHFKNLQNEEINGQHNLQ